MRLTVLLSIWLLMSSCASIDPTPFKGPNGGTAYAMKCSGFGRTLDACYQKAGEVCPSGYTIIDSFVLQPCRRRVEESWQHHHIT